MMMSSVSRASLLFSHITNGNTHAAREVLRKCEFVDLRDEGGQTALMCAAQLGNIDLVKELLQRDADIRAMDEDKWTPLIFAAREGHLDIVKALVEKGSDIDHTDVNGWTALMWASYKGHAEVVMELLQKGAMPNIQAHHGVTPIIWAAGRGHSEVVRALLRQGAKVNSADKYGTTALVWAARKGHIECVQALLENGANVDAAGMNSWTALIVASRGGFTDVVRLLLEERPNINAVDKDGLTSLACAAKEGHKDVVDSLLECGAYVNIQDKQEDTVLIHAVKGGHQEVVRSLLEKFADLDIQGHDKKTALFWAADKGYVDILEAILECNPNTELANKDSETPLLRATKNRNREVVRALLEKGAKVSAVDKCGDTPLHIAIRYRDKKICELLLRNPKNSRLLYKPNKDGETPYNIDCNHQKGILTQIFGARSFNPVDEVDGELSDLCSSSLADILSEPTLSPPVTVGLFARWGSGKSFILRKLQEEMRQFTQQDSKPYFSMSFIVLLLCAITSGLLFAIVAFISDEVKVGVGVCIASFGVLLASFGFIHFGYKKKWRGAGVMSVWLARQIHYLQLLGSLCFCYPPFSREYPNIKAYPIRFIFGEALQLSHLGGEAPLAQTLASISIALEKKLGFLAARLYQVVRTKPEEDKPRWKFLCCIPRFLVTLCVVIVFTVDLVLILHFICYRDEASRIPIIILSGIVLVATIFNSVNIVRFLYHLLWPPHSRLYRLSHMASGMKQEDFLHRLKVEADTLADLVQCFDAFQGRQTRMVVFVDGLDSCEQEQILRILDAIKTLFTAPNKPYIVNLVVDPYIITKAIDSNLQSVFRDAHIRGHDYLRNLIHLPFYLEVGAKIKEVTEPPGQNHVAPDTPRAGAGSNHLPSIPEVPENESTPSRNDKIGFDWRRNDTTLVTTIYGESSMRLLEHHNSQQSRSRGMTKDVSQLLSTDEQFSDLSPRSMRRILNIVSITARLLRANSTPFKWQTLAQWINMTERWPYRSSWLVVYCQDHEEEVEEEWPIRTLVERVIELIPTSREEEPLLEMDQEARSFVLFVNKHSSEMTIKDVRSFLPCTCNLDPQLRKQIRDCIEGREHAGTLPSQSNLTRPQSFGPAFHPTTSTATRASMHSTLTLSDTPSRLSFQMAASNPFNKSMNQQISQLISSPLTGSTESSPNALSVKDICDRLLKLEGIDKHAIPRYQTKIAQHHINGHVLIQCDLDELKDALDMTFGDWQLFRAMVLHLREQAVSNNHTPLNHSNTSIDSKSAENAEIQVTEKATDGDQPKDFLHMSYEELRTNSQVSSQRSSMATSQHSLGASRSDGLMKMSIAESPVNPQIPSVEEDELAALQTPDTQPDLLGFNNKLPQNVETTNIDGVSEVDKLLCKSSSSLSSESSTDETALRKSSHTDPPEELVKLNGNLRKDNNPTPANSKADVTEKRRRLSRSEAPLEEREPLLVEIGSSPSLLETSFSHHEPITEKRRGDTKESNFFERSKSEEGKLSGSSDECGRVNEAVAASPQFTTPKITAQWGKDLDRMFENIDSELARQGSASPPLEAKVLSPNRGLRGARTPVKREPEPHDLSLMASYSTFMPPVRELSSTPKGTPRRIPSEGKIKHAKSAGSLVSPGRVRPPKLSEINRLSEDGQGLQKQASQSSLKTLNQSFDEFIISQLEEQRRLRMPVLVYEDERHSDSATSSQPPDSPSRKSGTTHSSSSLDGYSRRRDDNGNSSSLGNHSIV